MKLEIGARKPYGPGWDTLDVMPRAGEVASGTHFMAKWGFEALPILDDSYDVIYACHVIEHIPWDRTHLALHQAFRVLKKGGAIEIHTVNFCKVIDYYMMRETDGWDAHGKNPERDPMKWVNSRLLHFGTEPQWHKALFDPELLQACLKHAGFRDIVRHDTPSHGEKHGPVSMGFRARKP